MRAVAARVHTSAAVGRIGAWSGRRRTEAVGGAATAIVLLAALTLSVAILLAHVADGGRYLDDWWLSAYVHFPQQLGFGGSFDYLNFYGGGRLGATFYWWLTYNLFIAHPVWQRAFGLLLAAGLTVVFYMLLRELRVGRLEAAAIAILSLALPVADSIHFWITPQVGQLCLAACAGGLLVALRGLRTPVAQSRWPRMASLGLYALSLLIAETTLPAIALSILVYRARAPWRQARKWWAQDLVLVAIAGVHYAVSAPKRRASSGGVGLSLHHALVIANQAITLFTGTLTPFDHARGWVLLGLAVIGGVFVRRLTSGHRPSETTGFWLRAAALAALFALASYAVYVPADPSYQPLVPAIGNRVNIGALLPLAVLVFAVVRLIAQLFTAKRAVVIVSAALYAILLAQALVQLDADRWLWDRAATQQAAVLSGLHRALPDPPPGVSLLVLNSPGVLTRFQRVGDRYVNVSVPVFSTWWELDAAVKLSYGRADIDAYPIWSRQPAQVACGKHDIYQLGLDQVRHVLAYGQVYLVDPSHVSAIPLDDQATCDRLIASGLTVRFDLPT
jgi:hypothetical protein